MTDKSQTPPETLLTFPCDFTIKVFGIDNDQYKPAVLAIINKYTKANDANIVARPSENGKYLALSITLHIDSKEQLDNIYRELSSSPQIIMAL